jgi:serine phosphatase RsbU (regulator of sigma subunit)
MPTILGMDAAIPVVMFSGILGSQMEDQHSLEERFLRLNRSLHRAQDSRTFVCFVMAELDPGTQTLRLSNGGCPYPYHFRASTGEVLELQIAVYPLGVRHNTNYPVTETHLHPRDRMFFCSYGIIEADNTAGEQFEFDQTTETIRKACEEGLSAEATIDRILEVVNAFKGMRRSRMK